MRPGVNQLLTDKDSLFNLFRTRPTGSPGVEGVRWNRENESKTSVFIKHPSVPSQCYWNLPNLIFEGDVLARFLFFIAGGIRWNYPKNGKR